MRLIVLLRALFKEASQQKQTSAAANIDVFSTILVIAVNDRVCEGFVQRL